MSNNQPDTPTGRTDLSSFSDLILFNGIMLFTKKDKGKFRIKYDRSSPWRNKAGFEDKRICLIEYELVLRIFRNAFKSELMNKVISSRDGELSTPVLLLQLEVPLIYYLDLLISF